MKGRFPYLFLEPLAPSLTETLSEEKLSDDNYHAYRENDA